MFGLRSSRERQKMVMLGSIFIVTKKTMAYCSLLIQWWWLHSNHFVWGRFWLWSWWRMILRMVLSPSDHSLQAAAPAQTPSFDRGSPPPRQKSWLSPHHPTPEQSPCLASSLASSPNTPQNYPYSSTGSSPILLQCLKALTLILLKRKLPSWKIVPKPPLCYVNIIAQDFIFPKG